MARACTTCAKAKARCIPGPANGYRCERCHRLDKECSSRPPAPPRVKKRLKRSRVAELEKRLDELSSQFDGSSSLAVSSSKGSSMPTPPPSGLAPVADATAASAATAAVPSHVAAKPPTSQVTHPGLSIHLCHIFPVAPSTSQTPTPSSDERVVGWESIAARPWHSLWPLPDAAKELLDNYRAGMEGLFPFVLVPSGATEGELRTRRPFLWKALMVTGSLWDGPRQVELGQRLLGDISTAALMDGQQSLDLLQGLMLLIAWFHYALKSTQLTNLLFLARSMCVNLGVKGGSLPTQGNSKANLHHLRAFAGTYYLNTLVFTTNKRTDVFMNASHLETCCSTLEAAKQYPSDEFLVKLVRVQQIAQAISSTMAFDSSQPPTRLPLLMVVQSFQAQLDALRASIPPHLSDNEPLSSHISIAEVLLTEFAISDHHCSTSVMPLTDRIQLLWSCVRSLRAFLNVRFAQARKDNEAPRFLCLSASDLAYVILTGMKLLTLRLPGWDLERIATELRLGELVERQAEELEADIARRNGSTSAGAAAATATAVAPSALGIDEPWERTLRLLRNVQELIRTQLEACSPQAGGLDMDGGQDLLTEFGETFWQDVLDESAWKADDTHMLFDFV